MISFTEDSVKNETEILKSYIEEAPRDTFKDILDAIDRLFILRTEKNNS